MFDTLLSELFLVIDQSFSWAEGIFATFGLSLFVIFVAYVGISFFVRNFIGVFLR